MKKLTVIIVMIAILRWLHTLCVGESIRTGPSPTGARKCLPRSRCGGLTTARAHISDWLLLISETVLL